jgi:acetyl esterase/lipase
VALDCLKSVVELDVLALDVPKVMSSDDSPVRVQTFGRDEVQWRQFSPLHQVAKDKGVPPFFLVVAHSSAANLEQAAALQKALQAAGVRCELVEAPQHDHNSLNRAIGVREDAVTRAMETFHDSLRRGAVPAVK